MALIHEQFIKVMQAVTSLPKGDRNRQQNFSFRGIDSVLNAVGPPLREHEVFILPEVTDVRYDIVEVGKNRTRMAHVQVEVDYRFVATDGSMVEVAVVGEAMDAGDKAISKAMSVALRTALLQMLALPTGEPDPDSYNYERSDAEPSQEVKDEQAEVREAILDWAKQNDKNIREVAEIFASNYHHPITEAALDELKEFYTKMSLGGTTETEAREKIEPEQETIE